MLGPRGDCFVATLVLPHNAPVLWAMPVGGLRPPARGLTVAAAENLASLPQSRTWLPNAAYLARFRTPG